MSGIEFGVSLSEPYDAASLIEISKHVEGLGFDSLWLTENVYSGVTALARLHRFAVPDRGYSVFSCANSLFYREAAVETPL